MFGDLESNEGNFQRGMEEAAHAAAACRLFSSTAQQQSICCHLRTEHTPNHCSCHRANTMSHPGVLVEGAVATVEEIRTQ